MNFSQKKQFSQKLKKNNDNSNKNSGYGSSGTKQQFNNNYNYQNINNPPQNNHYPIENNEDGNERPLWSYREIKYDHYKEPLNTEDISNKDKNKFEIENLQDEDKKYFNNLKYQKVKVTKKIKNNNIPQKIQKKGPVDDYEQQYNQENYNDKEELNNPNNKFLEKQNNDININITNNEQSEENINNEEEEGEIELAQKDIQDEYDKIIDDNEENYNNQNLNYNKEIPKEDINNRQNESQKNEINDDELQKENYDLDIDNLAEANSDNEGEENKKIPDQNYIQKESNNNNINKQMRPKPSFNDLIKQKITDPIDLVKTFPDGNLESWNCVADYKPD